MISTTVFTVDEPAKIGQSNYPLDKVIGGEFPYLNGVNVLSYTVPSAVRFRAASMTFSVNPNCIGIANAPSWNAGVYTAFIGATQLIEQRFIDAPTTTPQGYEAVANPWQCARQLPSLGEGVICPSGTAFTVKVTPAQNTRVVWYVTVTGKRGTTPDIQTAQFVTSTTTAAQTMLSYTPASDWTIMSIAVNCDMAGQYFGQGRICINGAQVAELPPLGMEATATTFADNRNYAGTQGALTIPLWGIEFGEESTFGFEPMAFTDDSARWLFSVQGEEVTLAPTPAEIAAAVWSRAGRTLT